SRKIDVGGLQVVPGAKTFRWRGKYLPSMNVRETLEVHLNVFGSFNPVLPETYRQCQFLFLANGSPGLQLQVLEQVPGAKLVVASYTVEDFSLDRLRQIERTDLDRRLAEYRRMLSF